MLAYDKVKVEQRKRWKVTKQENRLSAAQSKMVLAVAKPQTALYRRQQVAKRKVQEMIYRR